MGKILDLIMVWISLALNFSEGRYLHHFRQEVLRGEDRVDEAHILGRLVVI